MDTVMNEVEVLESSITFCNMTGDLTITWDDENKERILELIRAKMKDGYTFFTVKKVPLIKMQRKARVNKKNIDTIDNLVIPDAEFEKMVASMDDRELATLLSENKVGMAKRTGKSKNFDDAKRADKAEDLIGKQSIGFRKNSGG